MPLDGAGVYRHNTESAIMHSKAAGRPMPGSKEGQSTGDHTEVHDHGDGTFHTVDPEHGKVEHETIGHMHAHLSKVHGEPGHSHFHARHGGESAHSHSVESGGEPDHREHEDAQGMHEHFQEFAGDTDGRDGVGEAPADGGGGLY